jgi:hypothetical protein
MKKFHADWIIIFCLIVLKSLFNPIHAQESATIPTMNSTIIVDGIADEVWKNIEGIPVTNLIVGTTTPDSSDCSGYFKAFWNNDTLFVLMYALDDILYVDDPTVYNNDGFEIYLDVENLKTTVYTDSCYQFRFIPGSTEITGRWGLNVWTPPTVNFAIKVNSGKDRTIEAVFPLKELGRVSSVSAGGKIGFEVEILDNDGQGRDYVLSWNKNEHMAWYDPSKMGTLEFVDKISTTNNFELNRIRVFPNPNTEYVSVASEIAITGWIIFSLDGRKVTQGSDNLSNDITIDTRNLFPGIYILKVIDTTGQPTSLKFVKR